MTRVMLSFSCGRCPWKSSVSDDPMEIVRELIAHLGRKHPYAVGRIARVNVEDLRTGRNA